jgi:hypothetical protein
MEDVTRVVVGEVAIDVYTFFVDNVCFYFTTFCNNLKEKQ